MNAALTREAPYQHLTSFTANEKNFQEQTQSRTNTIVKQNNLEDKGRKDLPNGGN